MKFFTVPQPESTLNAKASQELALSEVPVICMAFLPTVEPESNSQLLSACHFVIKEKRKT